MRKEAMHKLKKSILVAMGVFTLVPYDKNILESACYKSPLSDTIRKRKFHYYFVFYLIYEYYRGHLKDYEASSFCP